MDENDETHAQPLIFETISEEASIQGAYYECCSGSGISLIREDFDSTSPDHDELSRSPRRLYT